MLCPEGTFTAHYHSSYPAARALITHIIISACPAGNVIMGYGGLLGTLLPVIIIAIREGND